MRPVQVGLVLPVGEDLISWEKRIWPEIRQLALDAEAMGFDTVWVADELLWKVPWGDDPVGFWECSAMTAAVAASTERIRVGTWVLSALHRNPGLTAKIAATLDEIAVGRFIFGFGAGHSGSQGRFFGYPPDYVVSRYEETLEIVLPLLREGRADFSGSFHSANDLVQRPVGPSGTAIPVLLGGHGPRTVELAVRHADIWSAFALESSLPEAFTERFELVDRTCEALGRDPASLGRSIGVLVNPTGRSDLPEDLGVVLGGSAAEIAAAIAQLAEMGATMVELMPLPGSQESVAALQPVLELLDG